jgi:hypothetical protein
MNEKKIAMVANGIHPPHEQNLLTGVGGIQFTAIDSIFPLHRRIPVPPLVQV